MDTASTRLAEQEDREQRLDQEDVFYRVVFFLAALTRGLFNRVLGADDPPFRAVMGKRGDAGVAARPGAIGVGSSSGATLVPASAAETPKRCGRAVGQLAGRSTTER